MQHATHYYRDELKRSEVAIAYLKKRGLSGEIAARFGIGYAPGGWQNLAAVFPDYQAKSLVQAGLVIEGERASATTVSATVSCSPSSTRAAR